MKKWYLITCIFVLMWVAGLGACLAPPEKKIPAVADAIPIELDKIGLEFEADREAAAAKWEGKLVKVTGVVKEISERWKLAVVVSPEAVEGEGWTTAQVRIPDKEALLALQKGQEVTIVGTFHEYMIAAKRVVVVDSYVVE